MVPARAPSITWSDRSSVNTSESKRGLVMTSVSRSSTLSRIPGSATAFARWRISSLNRNFSSWSSIGADGSTGRRWFRVGRRGLGQVPVPRGDAAAQAPGREPPISRGLRPRLRVEAAHRGGVGDALDGQQVGRRAHVHAFAEAHRQDVLERLDHDPLELVVDLGLVPEVAVEVLDPLEVADRHAAGVAQDVGDLEDAPLPNRIASASGVVGPLAASATILALIFRRCAP